VQIRKNFIEIDLQRPTGEIEVCAPQYINRKCNITNRRKS